MSDTGRELGARASQGVLKGEQELTDGGGVLYAQLSRAAFLKRGFGAAVGISGAATLLEACGGSGGSGAAATKASIGGGGKPPAKPTGSATWVFEEKPPTLDPSRATGVSTYTINQNLYDGLTLWRQEPIELEGALATKWESNADATEWTFHLREGVTFHDGTPLTSTAVRATFEYYKSAKGSVLVGYAGAFTKIDDSDPHKVVISYKEPFPDLARNAPLLGIISPKALVGSLEQISARLEKQSFGAGAFYFDAPFSGDTFTMKAFEGYWGAGPYLEEITGHVVPDQSAQIAALQAGNANIVLQIPSTDVSRLRSDSSVSIASCKSWLQQRMIFACDRAPFTDVRARQAVAYAINRQILIEKLLAGEGEVARSLIPTGCYGSAVPSLQYNQDIAKAKQLWQAAGGGSHTVTVAVNTTDSQTTVNLSQAIAGQLEEAGIRAKAIVINPTQEGEELEGGKTRFTDIIVTPFGWINGGPFFLTPGVFADTATSRYTGKDAVELEAKQNATADGPKRLALLKELQEVAQREVFVLPIAEIVSDDALDSNLHGYTSVKDGFMYRFATMYRS